MKLSQSSVHCQPTEEERAAQRAAALSQQRATAAAAVVAQPEAGPAFPRKDPAKQPPLVAGARMIDIRVGRPCKSLWLHYSSTFLGHSC